MAHEQGCRSVAHACATKGNDQVRHGNRPGRTRSGPGSLGSRKLVGYPRSLEDKLTYAHRQRCPIEEPRTQPITSDRNLWGNSIYLDALHDSWEQPPQEAFTLTRPPQQAPDEPALLTIGFQEGVPSSLNGKDIPLLELVCVLTLLGGEHGVGRSDVIEDRLLALKSRELYETPAATLLRLAHQDLESLVQTRADPAESDAQSALMRNWCTPGYGSTTCAMPWWVSLPRPNDTLPAKCVCNYTKAAQVVGRRSPHSLYDGNLLSQANQDLIDCQRVQAFTSLWSLPVRLAVGDNLRRGRRLGES